MTLESAFERASNQGRAALIPYVMAGDPDLETTEAIIRALSEAGADAIELGIPYGDPLADGPTIAAAGQRALRGNVTSSDVIALAGRVRDCAPIVLFAYFNLVYQYGIERFARDAASAGVRATIVPDIALEEGAELHATLATHGIEMPLLVAPTTPKERARRIAAQASGFVYVVSRLGVTGAGKAPDLRPLQSQIAMLREVTEKPLAAGFGISNADHVRGVAALADGVILGSAVIDAYAGSSGEEAAARVRAFVGPLIAALRA